jgi:hypothetical protein
LGFVHIDIPNLWKVRIITLLHKLLVQWYTSYQEQIINTIVPEENHEMNRFQSEPININSMKNSPRISQEYQQPPLHNNDMEEKEEQSQTYINKIFDSEFPSEENTVDDNKQGIIGMQEHNYFLFDRK